MSTSKNTSRKYNVVESNSNIVRKSNDFTRGKYATSTAFALQLVNIAATRISEEKDGTLSATLSPGELREIMHTTDRASLYKKLKKVGKEIMGSSAANNIFMEDGKGNFKYFAFITNADYVDGIFKITFNREMRNHIGIIKSHQGYTSYALANILDMSSPYSIRLYEVLRSEIYKAKVDEVVRKEYWLSELRFTIGLDELTQKMRDAKDNGATWDEVAELVKGDQKYPGWRNFKRYVLEKAQEELTQYADITFDYDVGRGGIGGKIERVIFYIRRNVAEEQEKKQREVLIDQVNSLHFQNQMEIQDLELSNVLRKYIGHNGLTGKDISTFLRDANNEEDLVIQYIDMADKQSYLSNYVGWIRDAIRGKYPLPTETIRGSKERADQINTVQQKLDEERANPESGTFKRLWEKTKKKEDYQDFLQYLGNIGMTEELLEEYFSTKDRVEGFVEWKKGGNPFC